jgi:GMP synthase (glutamine-hydrolyzing) (EC 6.3.5.2)
MLSVEKFLDSATKEINEKLTGKGILACSGGQDSTLLAIIANKAAGDRILSVFIDTGLVREGEKERVREIFERYSLNYRIVDASDDFLSALKGVTDPERKRKIIGAKFIEVFEKVAREFGAETLLQGTIAPDWIESGGSVRDTIKSHHNVGGLPDVMNLKLLEPLRDLYKDEVRMVSEYLHLPSRYPAVPWAGPCS